MEQSICTNVMPLNLSCGAHADEESEVESDSTTTTTTTKHKSISYACELQSPVNMDVLLALLSWLRLSHDCTADWVPDPKVLGLIPGVGNVPD